jgi:hypothetical protein
VSMIISSNMRSVALRTSFLAITISQCQMRVPRTRVSISHPARKTSTSAPQLQPSFHRAVVPCDATGL